MVIRNGLVAIQHHNSNPSPPVVVGETTYQAFPQHNVSLMWVLESDAEKIINSPENKTKSCDCNGGAYKPRFFYASEINVSIHQTGDYPR